MSYELPTRGAVQSRKVPAIRGEVGTSGHRPHSYGTRDLVYFPTLEDRWFPEAD